MDDASLLDGLTAAQLSAVVSEAAPLCILAGAGAGKTRVLTRRIAHRVVTGSADSGHVLALTFSRRAAGELGDRLASLGMRDRVAAGTFHAIAYAQLRRWWADRGEPFPVLLDRKARLISHLATARPGVEGVPVAELAAEIEWAKARLVSPDAYEGAAAATGRPLPAPAPAIAALYARYEVEKQRRRLVDFDDLLTRCAAAIEADPGFGAAQRWRWRHIFVDEFQDANPLQHRLLLAWLGSRLDLCVVGDPNQSIYAWNGADPALLTGVAARWPSTEVIRLDANHRSTPQIVAAAAGVLEADGAALSSTRPDGVPVTIRSYDDDAAEAHGVVYELRRARARGLAWSQLGVLVRTNAQTTAFGEAARAAGVPCRLAAGASLLDEPVAKTALAEVGGRPDAPLAAVIADLREMIDEAGADAGSRAGSDDDRRGVLDALVVAARQFQELDHAATRAGFVAWLDATIRAERVERSGADDAVTVCTFHRAKGLEWPAVWVAGLERGLVPIGHATTAEAQAEERRLLYVALTRAEQELHCSWAEQRTFRGHRVAREPSPWLDAVARAVAAAAGCAGGSTPDMDAGSRSGRLSHLAAGREALSAGRARRARGSVSALGGLPDVDVAVLDALRTWRGSTARAAAVPPYVLFHDATLAALASLRPSTPEELLAVPGLGPVKSSRYGATLLALVAEHRVSA